jgi:tryptophan 2,3-dioxygenase
MSNGKVYYGEYLQLDKILGAQAPESEKANVEAHDEMLFIVIHQAYELWFKQILHEVGSVLKMFASSEIDDDGPAVPTAVHRLRRVNTILQVLVKQIDILETMTPLDFLDFRDLLRPASGFQSIQFKELEARLGLKMDERFGKQYYTSQLKPDDKNYVQGIENQPTLIELINSWLERMPFFEERFWNEAADDSGRPYFWSQMRKIYQDSLSEGEQGNLKLWDQEFFGETKGRLSAKAKRSALFIMLYRDLPLFQLPFSLLQSLLDIDESMATWRYRHINMVSRMIGMRVGTGGSTGKKYLKGAMDSHYIFSELADLSSFLIDRRRIPELPDSLAHRLGYTVNRK